MGSNVIEMPLQGYHGIPREGYEDAPHITYQTSVGSERQYGELFVVAMPKLYLPEPPHNCKWCPSCGEWKDKTTQWHRNSARRDGLQTICRACKNDEERRRYRKNKVA